MREGGTNVYSHIYTPTESVGKSELQCIGTTQANTAKAVDVNAREGGILATLVYPQKQAFINWYMDHNL